MGMANRSSAVWRYFNIGATDESKAICKICEKAVSRGGHKHAQCCFLPAFGALLRPLNTSNIASTGWSSFSFNCALFCFT